MAPSGSFSRGSPLDTSAHVRRAVDGDGESLDWLIGRFSPLLLAQASERLGPHLRRVHDPEDVVQEAWAVALPKLAGLTARDGRYTPVVLKYLGTTVLYRVQNLLRKQLGHAAVIAGEDGLALSQLPAETVDRISRAVRSERERALRSAIDALPKQDRRIVLRRGVEQEPVQEIAAELGLAPNTVSVKYRRALAKLRDALPGSVFEELDED